VNTPVLVAFSAYRWNFSVMQGDSIPLFMSPWNIHWNA